MRAAGVPGLGEKGKTCRKCQTCLVDNVQGVLKHFLGFCGKSSNHVRNRKQYLSEPGETGGKVSPHPLADGGASCA